MQIMIYANELPKWNFRCGECSEICTCEACPTLVQWVEKKRQIIVNLPDNENTIERRKEYE